MIKLQINNQFRKDLNQEAKQNTDKNQSNVQKELNISELDYDDDGENPHIKVYKNQEEKQFSITTPRQEMMNSIEKVRTTEECEKTIKGNTIEEDNLRHDTFLESSSNSMYFTSKESASHEKYRHFETSSGCHNSNSKYSYDYSGAKHSKMHSDRSINNNEYDDSKNEKGLIYVEGRNKSQIKVPMIPIDKGNINNKSKDSKSENNESKQQEPNNKNLVKYFPMSIASRNSNQEAPYNRNKISPTQAMKNLEEKNEYSNMKIGARDLEVIKENHSEFSNSNSVIETFRNKRKSNISSSGNNSGNQRNMHDAEQDMINEEDEEDIENDTTSFRGPRNLK